MREPAALYTAPLPESFLESLGEMMKSRPLEVFFRADDIGVMDERFIRMMELFARYRVPLCLAVVPTWMTPESRRAMARFCPEDPLWCWHQHGYGHRNHETTGKKNEFGQARSRDQIRADLLAGRHHLEELFGEFFLPVFTPPWNRCSTGTLALLAETGFQAVSRSHGDRPDSPLPDFPVNVDLHTLRQPDRKQAMARLSSDWQRAVEQGRLAIMLHHQLMNEHAFMFLEQLLALVQETGEIRLLSFRELLINL